MKKIFAAVLTLMLTAVLAAGCAATDVVLKYGRSSFEAITDAFPDLVSSSDGYFTLTADGVTSLKVSSDFKAGHWKRRLSRLSGLVWTHHGCRKGSGQKAADCI